MLGLQEMSVLEQATGRIALQTEAQFLLKQNCPHWEPNYKRIIGGTSLAEHGPIVIWVELSSRRCCPCGHIGWAVLPQEVLKLYPQASVPVPKNPRNRYVCEGAGHLIE
jgi:hypothetical protein